MKILLSEKNNAETLPLAIVLHNIRSAYNVGAIFRTADAVGATEVILAGYTPTPTDRFGRPRKDIAKAALGAESTIPWRHVEDTLSYLSELQQAGWGVVALEQVSQAIPYTAYAPRGPVVLVVGNEVEGVPQDVCALADTCIHIPMRGKKESLNVSVATGIALYHLRRD